MSFNGPINGDYSTCDFTKAPWTAGIMTLTHDECVFVSNTIDNEIRPTYVPQPGEPEEPSDFWLQSEYNKFVQWEKGINGDTYDVLINYKNSKYTKGINENGIID
jgi:hypothetical protein